MKKRWISVFLTMTMFLSLCLPTAWASSLQQENYDPNTLSSDSELESADTDMGDTWYTNAVAYCYKNELMPGAGTATFSPDQTTSRGTIVTILHSLKGKPEVNGEVFPDVTDTDHLAAAAAWAAKNGVVSGYDNGNFGPSDAITREQLAVMLWQYAKLVGMDVSVGEDTNILSYMDFDQISEWAISAIQWACGEGLLSGMGDGTLNPKGNATLAQSAVILQQFCQKLDK